MPGHVAKRWNFGHRAGEKDVFDSVTVVDEEKMLICDRLERHHPSRGFLPKSLRNTGGKAAQEWQISPLRYVTQTETRLWVDQLSEMFPDSPKHQIEIVVQRHMQVL